jgi:aryl sulfotransferase
MSLWNHYRSYTDLVYEMLAAGDPEGGPLPKCPNEPHTLWQAWITRSWFPWEKDGWPFWSHHYHAASFWQFRHLPNLLLVHYNDLLANLADEMRRIANFVDIDVPAKQWPILVDAARFEAMKREADRILGDMSPAFKDGTAAFIHKGVNGRWKKVLGPKDLLLYERAAATLDPDLRSWLESGRGGHTCKRYER